MKIILILFLILPLINNVLAKNYFISSPSVTEITIQQDDTDVEYDWFGETSENPPDQYDVDKLLEKAKAFLEIPEKDRLGKLLENYTETSN